MKGLLIINAIVASVAMHNGVHLYHDYNQASGVIVPQGVSQGGTVIFLSGENSTLESCEERCATYEKQRCWSFVIRLISLSVVGINDRIGSHMFLIGVARFLIGLLGF